MTVDTIKKQIETSRLETLRTMVNIMTKHTKIHDSEYNNKAIVREQPDHKIVGHLISQKITDSRFSVFS